MTTHTIDMQFMKSTKGTHVYKCDPDNLAGISSVYIRRDSLPSFPPPENIKLTVQYDD